MVAINININFDFKGSPAMLANLTNPFSFPNEFVRFGKSETAARRNKTLNARLD